MKRGSEYYIDIVNSFLKRSDLKQSDEEQCIFFNDSNLDFDDFGKYISALSNLTIYKTKAYAYALWGVDCDARKIVGTSFIPPDTELLSSLLSANSSFTIFKGEKFIVLEVQCAINTTVQFKGDEYIIQNGNLVRLSSYPEIEKRIWKNLNDQESFESQPAMENVSAELLERYLDCKKLFEMLDMPYPRNSMSVINLLMDLRFVSEQNTGKYTINNLGALLLAKRLSSFQTVQFKAVRVLKYSGLDITQPAHEQIGDKGYIVGFEGLIGYIMAALPSHEVMEGSLRKQASDYPILSIRELVANALIHQDLKINGCPIVSIFPDHIEITNPGTPLISHDRFIDTPPCSRNEALAAAMHKVGICEERGSGYDKVIAHIEEYNLPAPQITESDLHTKVTLYAKKIFDSLTKEEKMLACYNHTCLNYVNGRKTNNTSLRKRFQLTENERYKVSRVFTDTAHGELIKSKDGTGTKNSEYLPYWV